MESHLLPELRFGKRAHLSPFSLPFHSALYRWCIACVIGLSVLCLQFVAITLAVYVLSPSEPLGRGSHLGLWLLVSIGFASVFAAAAHLVAAIDRSVGRTYSRLLLRKVAVQEQGLFEEIEQDLTWLDEDEPTRTVATP